jgi:hypothetical protein
MKMNAATAPRGAYSEEVAANASTARQKVTTHTRHTRLAQDNEPWFYVNYAGGMAVAVGPYFAIFFAKFRPFFEKKNFREI